CGARAAAVSRPSEAGTVSSGSCDSGCGSYLTCYAHATTARATEPASSTRAVLFMAETSSDAVGCCWLVLWMARPNYLCRYGDQAGSRTSPSAKTNLCRTRPSADTA